MSDKNSSSYSGDRIAKVLSRAGVASRRDAERMVQEGRVKVNGALIDSPALNVTHRDRIEVDGNIVGAAEAPRVWMYNKPIGLVTSARDEKGRDTVFDALPEDMPRVMSVGRLDINSEGLLLLTNDGGMKRTMELPETGWLRRYRVRVHGAPRDSDFAPLRAGITVEGEKFQPMDVTLDRQQGRNAWLTVGIREGKNREIRRAMEQIGVPVNRLIRISYGPFELGDLKTGDVEELRPGLINRHLGDGENPARTRERPTPKGKPASGPRGNPRRSETPSKSFGKVHFEKAHEKSDERSGGRGKRKPDGKSFGKRAAPNSEAVYGRDEFGNKVKPRPRAADPSKSMRKGPGKPPRKRS